MTKMTENNALRELMWKNWCLWDKALFTNAECQRDFLPDDVSDPDQLAYLQ